MQWNFDYKDYELIYFWEGLISFTLAFVVASASSCDIKPRRLEQVYILPKFSCTMII
jgi:hypothetical protein